MIEVRVKFWTNDLADEGKIWPGHMWDSGVVVMTTNKSHGIVPNSPTPFHSLADLSGKIERVLIDHKLTAHKASRTKKYMAADS